MKAGLIELLFYVNLSGSLQRQQIGTHPGYLRHRQSSFGYVDGCAGKVRRGDITFSRRSIAIHFDQMPLIFDRAHSGIDLQRTMEAGVVYTPEIAQEMGCPRTAI